LRAGLSEPDLPWEQALPPGPWAPDRHHHWGRERDLGPAPDPCFRPV
jgi:hypothetical protein